MFLSNIIIVLLCLINCNYAFNPLDYPVCRKKNSSCSYLFGKESDFCRMIYYNVSEQPACDSAYNEFEKRNHDVDLGTLILRPFYGDIRTVFNVSFTNIKFEMLRIRFQMYKDGFKVLNYCMVKEFVISGSVAQNQVFSYVCPWADAFYEGQEAQFHFDYGIKEYVTRRKYIFTVPKQEFLNTKNISAFAYIDYSDIHNLILIIVPLYQFNTSYRVEYMYENKDNETTVLSNDTLLSGSHNFDTIGDGKYYFRVSLISDYCNNEDINCTTYQSPEIRIDGSNISLLLIGMAGGVTIMIAVFGIIIFMWYKTCLGFPRPTPKVLLVSVPTNNAHAIVAPALAEFLKNICGVNVLLDIDNVRLGHNDSYQWLKDEIYTCTHIIFLRSNDNFDNSKVTYLNTDIEAIDLLNPKFTEERKYECILTFPFSSKDRVPKLNHIHKCFNFEEDRHFKKLITFITNENYNVQEMSVEYQELLNSIHLAENEPLIKLPKQNIDVIIKVPDDNISDMYKFEPEGCDFEKQDIDISDCNITGDKQETQSEKSNDSDLEDYCLLGKV